MRILYHCDGDEDQPYHLLRFNGLQWMGYYGYFGDKVWIDPEDVAKAMKYKTKVEIVETSPPAGLERNCCACMGMVYEHESEKDYIGYIYHPACFKIVDSNRKAMAVIQAKQDAARRAG